MSKLIAITSQEGNQITGPGPLGSPGGFGDAVNKFTSVISKVIGLLTVAAIVFFVFQFLMGAISWIGAGGDKQKIEQAQKRMTGGLVGLVIVFFALILASVVGLIFGIDILNIGEALNRLNQF